MILSVCTVKMRQMVVCRIFLGLCLKRIKCLKKLMFMYSFNATNSDFVASCLLSNATRQTESL
jgi:hypothetical protein